MLRSRRQSVYKERPVRNGENVFADLRHVGDFLTRNSLRLRDEFALAYQERRFTWSELNQRANRFANGLQFLGIRQGEPIAVYARNCNEFVEALFGAAKIGVPIVTVNYRLVQSEVEHIIRDSGSIAILCESQYEAIARAVQASCSCVRRLISIGDVTGDTVAYDWLIAHSCASEPVPNRPIQADDPVMLIYTSGTTGLPKGAVWWNNGTILNHYTFAHAIGIRYGMKLVLPAPLYATAGACMIMAAACVGAAGVLVNFDAIQVLAILEREKADFINLVPATINFILNVPQLQEYDLSHLKTILYAGAVMPVPLLRRAIHEIGCDFRQVFGMTETCGVGTVLEPWEHVLDGDEQRVRRLASCGRQQVNVQARIVSEDGDDVKPGGEIGELIIKSDGNIRKYHNLPDATAATVRAGWVYTGDCGWIDEDGYIFIVDRKKDMIVSGALNVYPAEIESVLYQHPDVLECAVIGIPDDTWGEAIKAVVVVRPGRRLTEEDVIDFCRNKMAPFKRPRSVEFIENLPRNVSGKILKRALREPYWKEYSRKV